MQIAPIFLFAQRHIICCDNQIAADKIAIGSNLFLSVIPHQHDIFRVIQQHLRKIFRRNGKAFPQNIFALPASKIPICLVQHQIQQDNKQPRTIRLHQSINPVIFDSQPSNAVKAKRRNSQRGTQTHRMRQQFFYIR